MKMSHICCSTRSAGARPDAAGAGSGSALRSSLPLGFNGM